MHRNSNNDRIVLKGRVSRAAMVRLQTSVLTTLMDIARLHQRIEIELEVSNRGNYFHSSYNNSKDTTGM